MTLATPPVPRARELRSRHGVVDLLEAVRAGGRDPSRVILVGHRGEGSTAAPGPGRLELAELERVVSRRAEELTPRVEPGRIEPRVLQADPEGILDLLALWRLGVTPAPLNPGLSAAERAAAEEVLRGRDGRGAQVVLWTSGTSGAPRGIALGWDGLARHVEMVTDRLSLDPRGDVWLASLSPAHVGGFMLVVRALLRADVLVAVGRPGPDELVGILDRAEGGSAGVSGRIPDITHLSLVPTQLRRLLDRWGDRPAPETLRCVLLGGARTPAPLLERARVGGWPVALTWGMTEMASQLTTAPPEEVGAEPGTVGRPLDGVRIRRDPETGELLARSPAAALGYADGRPLPDRDGWYPTGDLGRIGRAGRLWITGRRADRIVTGGVTVEAGEVEEALRAHPAVADACVVGLPDEEWGERVAVWIVPVEGEFDRETVDAWARERLGSARRPRVWHRGGALPRNANGKVDRARVRSVLAAPRG